MKDQVSQVGVGNKLTVRKIDGTEYHGALQAVESETFSVQEVDLKTTETVPYREVKKVYKDDRHKSLITGRRVTPKPLWVGVTIGAALLVSLMVIVAVELRKS